MSNTKVGLRRPSGQREKTARMRAVLFGDASRILEREYSRKLELEAVAHRIATSRRQLQRAFSEIGRTTFRDHLTKIRMERAAEMLSCSSMSVAEIAKRVGYRQPAQFSKTFHRYLGLVPSAYRRINGRTRSIGWPTSWK